MLSGTYIITQGSFKIKGGSVSTAADGALIYIASANSTGSFQITADNTFTLNGLTGTTNDGLVLWEDQQRNR